MISYIKSRNDANQQSLKKGTYSSNHLFNYSLIYSVIIF